MTIRKFRVLEGLDLSCELSIDTDKITDEVAQQMVDFWHGGEDTLEAAEGDLIQAVARIAGSFFLNVGMNNSSVPWCQKELDEAEGYPGPDSGITLLNLEIPEPDSESVDVYEL